MSPLDSLSQAFVDLRSKLAKSISGIVPPKEIEDIVQETYVRVRRASSRGRVRRPESLMYRTARNLALDHLKRAETRLVDAEDDVGSFVRNQAEEPVDQTYRSAASDQEFAQFCDAVRFLPIQCRRAFVLRKVYGFSQKEIAENMRISVSTVEKHIAEGVKRTMLQIKSRNTREAVEDRGAYRKFLDE